jgi:hypothetical protein
VATKLKELKLDDAHATAILEKAIEYESFTEEMPGSKRERIKAATEQVALMVDAWVDDEVTPDNEDEDVAQMGEAIAEIFEIAGIEIDEEGEVNYGEPGDIEEAEEEDEGDEDDSEDDDGEAAVDINDIIDGYDDLSATSKVKAIKKLELDMEDDDDFNTAVAIYEHEEQQEKPSSRVLSWLDDLIPKDDQGGEDEPEDDEDAEEGDEDSEAEAEEEEEAEESGEWEEPWARYDKQTAVEVKKALDKLMAKDELTIDMAQYVIDYESARQKPPTRKRVVDYATKLLGELEEGEEDNEAEEQEEAPKPKRAGRPKAAAKGRGVGKRKPEPEPEEEEDEAPANGAGSIFVISGGDEDITAYGVYGAGGAVADLLAQGVESVTVEAG